MPDRRRFFKIMGSAIGLLSLPNLSFGSLAPISNIKTKFTANPFDAIRQQLLVPQQRTYLNTGSLGPSPQPVLDAVIDATRQLEENPAPENWGDLGRKMEAVRTKVGQFINAPAEDIILTRNTTEGLSLIAQSLYLEPGDEILTTTREHGGGEVGYKYMAERDGALFKKIELPIPAASPEQIVSTIARAITPKTRIILLSHVNTITGMKMPFKEVSEIARAKNILLIADGAQAPGLVKVDIDDLGVDAYATSGHKWMLGPKETGFLYLSKRLQEQFSPIFTSKGFQSYSASSGTRNVSQFIGLGKSIAIHQEIGSMLIEDHCKKLAEYCRKKLETFDTLSIISPLDPELQTGIVSVKLSGGVNSEIAAKLREKDIVVKVLPGINALRFSCHMFISEKDIDRLVRELGELID